MDSRVVGDVVRASVHAGGLTIPYVQAGVGAPVLLLVPGTPESNETLHFRTLAHHFRVLAPARPIGGELHADGEAANPAALSRLLRYFLDGLGLGRVGLVAEEPLGVAALEFAPSEPERIGGLALVFGDEASPIDPAGMMGDGFVEAGLSVIVLRSEVGEEGRESRCPELIRFLTETVGTPNEGKIL